MALVAKQFLVTTDRIDLTIIHHDILICILSRKSRWPMMILGCCLFQAGCQSLTVKHRLGIISAEVRSKIKSWDSWRARAIQRRWRGLKDGFPTLNRGVATIFEILDKFIGGWSYKRSSSVASLATAHIFFNRTREQDIGLKTMATLAQRNQDRILWHRGLLLSTRPGLTS